MPYYIDLENKTHFLDSEEHECFLPEGSRRMTSEEEAIIVSKNAPTAEEIRTYQLRKKIAELEATVTPRRLRDAILSGDSSFILDVDAQIQALREELVTPPALSEPAGVLTDEAPLQPSEDDSGESQLYVDSEA